MRCLVPWERWELQKNSGKREKYRSQKGRRVAWTPRVYGGLYMPNLKIRKIKSEQSALFMKIY